MSGIARPETAEQLRDLVAWAAAEDKSLEIVGSGSKRPLGRPVRADHVVELGALAGITLYEPDELVLSAGAATPMREIEAALAERDQQLEFEPPDYTRLLVAPTVAPGAGNGQRNEPAGSIGGVVACNLGGPRRIKSGAARDHFLGFHAVSGRGEIFKSGGRVVKNVTGYDLSKLIAGSWGTLAIMTAVTLKVLPRPEKTRTVLVFGVDAGRGGEALTAALLSPHEISGAAWLPAPLAAASRVELVAGRKSGVAALRVEGPGPSVEYRCRALREELSGFGPTEELHSNGSLRFWGEIRDVLPFAAPGDDRIVWKISVPPAAGPALVGELAAEDGADAFLDWGGGLVWLALPPAPGAGAGPVRAAVARTGGHATLLRADETVRGSVAVFQPEAAAREGLTRRVKAAFDPKGILNPGRMYAEV